MKRTPQINFLITGTSRGIGLELTRQVIHAGYTVYALAREPERSAPLQSLKQEAAGRLITFAADVLKESQILMVAEALRGKAIDVLINNAGKYGGAREFEAIDLNEVQSTIETNSIAPMRITRAFLPHLRQSAQPKLVHITSLMGSIGDNSSGGSYGYRMSKAALNMFSKTFAIDHPGVISIVVHPGWVQTEMGGPNAPLAPESSAKGILSVIERVTPKESGKFFDYEGDELPW
ncbi:MAG TPA: SDR family oxidoreductase [Bdellovibrionales bacterium]|nr:MAG: hypothetical protein A2Z97_15770 [Bdellovibrionales bacterium GWB1_52_6]OFZ06430.1 MAG: hypothetical protein A2X97_03145 [Bdellovibrionales bacterium GWA1_52_35]OFZ40058.1 MAG: hypothetical protein A2070_02485 [Bdellovibrionales bacterium GWC1_52_8]HAR44192.1 SDR family oxidoreductase [Bdellovibrionales bacterium]HCM40189.1 SDR family oxidoreductase [Bdellovibrionales bacterium]